MPLFQILTAGLRLNAPQNKLNTLNSPVALETSRPRGVVPVDKSVFNFEFTTAASSDEEDDEKKSDWEQDVKTKRTSRLGTSKYLPPKTELTDKERFEVMKEGFLNINGKPVYHTLQSGKLAGFKTKECTDMIQEIELSSTIITKTAKSFKVREIEGKEYEFETMDPEW